MADQLFILRPDDEPARLQPPTPKTMRLLQRDPRWTPSFYRWRRPERLPRVGTGTYYDGWAEVIEQYDSGDYNFRNADLTSCDLSGETLAGACLAGANLRSVTLSDANLSEADLSGADLTSATLYNANLEGANLSGAWIAGADLHQADNLTTEQLASCAGLEIVKADLFGYLDHMPHEVPGLLEALRTGKVDGTTYDGACSCLAGTCERLSRMEGRGERDSEALAIAADLMESLRDASSPRETWFFQIRQGDTPRTSAFAELTEQWLEEYLETLPSRYVEVPIP